MAKSSKKSKKKDTPLQRGKEEKLFRNLLKITEQFMSGKSFTPMTERELLQKLSLPEQHEEIFKSILKKLVEDQLIIHSEGRYSWKRSRLDVATGIIKMHPRGFGFVQIKNHPIYTQDIFIPKPFTANAVDGDKVEVLVNQDAISEKGPEGRVIAILSRSRTHMAGIIKASHDGGYFSVYVPLLGTQQKVLLTPTEEMALKIGDRIVMEIVEWGKKETETYCRFSHYLGNISDPSCDVFAAVEEYELRRDFPLSAVEEALSFGKQVSQKDIAQREDLRSLTTVTIDPDTAKDFDDALSIEKDAEGGYLLGVHIADVSHYVKPGTSCDAEALERCNSTYFPGTCLPMLPPALSENLCSLKPNVNRLTVSVFISIDNQGNTTSHRITRSVIKSAKRFTYKEAKKVLDGEKTSKHLPMLQLMVELCRLLKQKRQERGSIEFSLPELVVCVNDKGVPEKTDYVFYDITHQMVEEFMLKANEIVALDLHKKGKNLTYRVHEVPAEDNLRDFAFLAAAFGFKIADYPTSYEIQKLFEEASSTPYGNYLASSYIRRMRLAAYSAENIGHYGLSLTHYCHFTSPIRRYVDLVVHRILFGESDDLNYLQTVSSRCSEQERISAKAENSVLLLKKLRLLHSMQEENPYREYEAIITKVKNFGLYFEVIDLMLEGFIHISELGNDYYIYEESKMRLRGSKTGSYFSPGERITVFLKEVDFIVQETRWYLSEKPPVKTEPKLKAASKKEKRSVNKEAKPLKPRTVKTKKEDAPKEEKKERTKKKSVKKETVKEESIKKESVKKSSPSSSKSAKGVKKRK